MPDEMDCVQELSLKLTAAALKAHKSRPGVNPAVSAIDCAICDEPIPEARRLAMPGCCKCIVCQTEYESMHGR